MTLRFDPLPGVRPLCDVATARGLARDFRGPVAVPSPSERGEARLLAGLLVLCLVWGVLAVVGAVALGCWLWPDRVVIGQLVFWLTIAGLMAVAARVVVAELRKGRR